MSLVIGTERVEEAQALWTSRFVDKELVQALTEVLVAECQELETVAGQLLQRLDIDSQVGAQLDSLGVLVGQAREGRTDDVYRLWLKARILVNRSSGSLPDLYGIARQILNQYANLGLYLRQIPTGHVLETTLYVPEDPVSIQRLMQEASSSAVPFYYQWVVGADNRLTLGSGTTPVFSNSGFDNARLVDWLGPDQTVDYHATFQSFFGRHYVDGWDTRNKIENDSSEVLSLPGSATTLLPANDLPAVDPTFTKTAPLTTGIALGEGNNLQIASPPLSATFEGAKAFTVACYIEKTNTLLQLFYAFASESVFNVNVVQSYIQGNAIRLVLQDSATTTLTVTPTITNTYHSVVISYNGAGKGSFWLDGVKYTATGTHRTPTGIQYFSMGDHPASSVQVGNHYHTTILNRAVSDDEALVLGTWMEKEFSDSYV